jgi:hypothetical protein
MKGTNMKTFLTLILAATAFAATGAISTPQPDSARRVLVATCCDPPPPECPPICQR